MSEGQCAYSFQNSNSLFIRFSGEWTIENGMATIEPLIEVIRNSRDLKSVIFDAKDLTDWDSLFAAAVARISTVCQAQAVNVDMAGIPSHARSLVEKKIASQQGTKRVSAAGPEPWLVVVGGWFLDVMASAASIFEFVGDCAQSLVRFATGKARYLRSDLFLIMQQSGAQALPIVSLISFLVGLILAFVGALQLKMFGAQIYIADVVGVGMARVMAPIMTGVIMSGRTGASFAAQIGTMQTNEEVDALRTMGISPVDFLVMPRILALVTMMPLLCLYSVVLGICGGLVGGMTMFDLNPAQYLQRTREAVTWNHIGVGLVHGCVFGVIVSLTGCFKGIRCGRSAADVGQAATATVVNAITYIVLATAVITFICQVLNI